jgi:hypothetical protein
MVVFGTAIKAVKNQNFPQQTVLSGKIKSLQMLLAILETLLSLKNLDGEWPLFGGAL